MIAVLWTILLAGSLEWNLYLSRKTLIDNATDTARIAFEKDVMYRSWNSSHGGVYVLVTDSSQPNPYMKDAPERDFTASNGQAYTLVNPAYMTRQVFELQKESTGILGHITSLKPLRPQNAADEWETKALKAFESGSTEFSSVETLNGQSYLRFMKPLKVEEKCLACHATQGYEIGEIRGGISESVPLARMQHSGLLQTNSLILGHAVIWVFGLMGTFLTFSVQKRAITIRQKAEDDLIRISTHDSLTGLFNRNFFEENFQNIEEIKVKPVTILTGDLDNLKVVNDTLGHVAGDQLLLGAAEVLKASFRSEDIVARTGGDEFSVILLNSDESQIARAIERIRQNEKKWNESNPGFNLSISIGAASTSIEIDLSEALKLADQNMYADKARRKSNNEKLASDFDK